MSAVDVSAACRRLLPALDLDSTTERMVRELVAKQLGVPVDAHKQLIKEEIDRYLSESAAAEGTVEASAPGTATRDDADYVPTATEVAAADDGDDDDYTAVEDDEDFEGTGAKRKRAAAAAGGRGAKQARVSAGGGVAGAPEGQCWRLGTAGRKYARVECWKGSWRVDLREFYEKDGKLQPGAKGIVLSPHEWGVLAAALPAVGAALLARDEKYCLQLAEARRVTTGAFNNTMLANIREYFQAGSEWRPGKKGIALSPDALKGLADAAADITAALPASATAAPPPAAHAAARPAVAAVAASGGGAGAEGEADFVDLGGRKRARINVFKGTKYVDLREFYEKDGEQLPGKKGISMPEGDWAAVKVAMAAAGAAAQRRELGYCVQLSGKRKLGLSEFKGTVYVSVREYYEKDGKELPGAKGLNMNLDQWNKLVAGAPLLDRLLAAA